jgi:hypothetical protein
MIGWILLALAAPLILRGCLKPVAFLAKKSIAKLPNADVLVMLRPCGAVGC